MNAIAPIDFEKGLTAPINFRWKQESKGILHPCIEILNGLLGILHPSTEIPNDAPVYVSFDLYQMVQVVRLCSLKTDRI